jgi:hypothetical protein
MLDAGGSMLDARFSMLDAGLFATEGTEDSEVKQISKSKRQKYR